MALEENSVVWLCEFELWSGKRLVRNYDQEDSNTDVLWNVLRKGAHEWG